MPSEEEHYESDHERYLGYIDEGANEGVIGQAVTSGYLQVELNPNNPDPNHNHTIYDITTQPTLHISNNTIRVENCTIETNQGAIEVRDDGITFNCNVRVNGNLEVDSIHFMDKDKEGNIQVVKKDPDEYIKEHSSKKTKMSILMED